MATAAREVTRFRLPSRIRAKTATANTIPARLGLADRIANLPGVHVVEQEHGSLPCGVDVFLSEPDTRRKRRPALLFCSMSATAIEVHGLDNWDRYQVLARGWGRLDGRGVQLFMPRDEDEMEQCWAILLRAYQSSIHASAAAAPERFAWFDRLPSYSRTSLQ